MTLSVTDALSHSNDHVKNVAEALRRSKRMLKVFKAIYTGKTSPKRVSMLVKVTRMTRVEVLQQGSKLDSLGVVSQVKKDAETAYRKIPFWVQRRNSVMRLAANPKKLKALPTKYTPSVSVNTGKIRITVKGKGAKFQVSTITCDDFDQFAKVKKIKNAPSRKILESAFKRGIQKLVGETGEFRDWGGERNDLYSTKSKFKGQRRAVAFAFKGPGIQGMLTPKKMGKNGDQIQRLFKSSAEVFVLQYHDQIDQSVIEQMQGWAQLKSIMEGTRIWYGTIDGDDTNRLLKAYPKQFGLKR
jgi:hypothetical protein